MGLIDQLRKVSGQIKNRLASSVGALRGVTVGATRARRGVRFAARATRLTSPLGIGLTAISFGPEILKGVRTAGRFLQRAIPRGVAFVGGRRVISGIAGGGGAGLVTGVLTARSSGGVQRPSDFGDPSLQTRLPNGLPKRRPAPLTKRQKRIVRRGVDIRRGTRKKRRAPKRRARVSRKRKRRTHRSPRHKGHKRVSFTTAEGKKVSFLVNPKARHR